MAADPFCSLPLLGISGHSQLVHRCMSHQGQTESSVRHRTYLLEVFFEANDFAVLRCFWRTGIFPFAYSPAASALFEAFLYSATFCEIAIELWPGYF